MSGGQRDPGSEIERGPDDDPGGADPAVEPVRPLAAPPHGPRRRPHGDGEPGGPDQQ